MMWAAAVGDGRKAMERACKGLTGATKAPGRGDFDWAGWDLDPEVGVGDETPGLTGRGPACRRFRTGITATADRPPGNRRQHLHRQTQRPAAVHLSHPTPL